MRERDGGGERERVFLSSNIPVHFTVNLLPLKPRHQMGLFLPWRQVSRSRKARKAFIYYRSGYLDTTVPPNSDYLI